MPVRCAGCGRYLSRPICPECNAAMPVVRGNTCSRCGKPTMYPVDGCLQCGSNLRQIDHAVAMAVYEEPLRSIIHKLKYGNGWRLAAPLGAMAAVCLAPHLASPRPAITYVPMHRRRKRERGYDHAERLAAGVARALGLEVVPLLERTRPSPSQASLGYADRRSNVRGAFRQKAMERMPEEVVVVDDVLTTGSTMGECASVLKGGGARRVLACVLARDLLA
ncbi:MAG: ComF family protein [Actinobacteria bacterium]|nr:ComF family protein [Actinomycetota bacterium]